MGVMVVVTSSILRNKGIINIVLQNINLKLFLYFIGTNGEFSYPEGNYNLTDIVTPIKVDKYEALLKLSKFDPEKTKSLVTGFKEGFDVGYRGPLQRCSKACNIPITVGSEADVWSKLMKEVKAGRHAGPYSKIPYRHYIQSPIGLVPKAGGQTHLIFHLSFNFGEEENQKSLNYHTPDEICSVKYNDLDYAVQSMLNLLTEDGNQDCRESDEELKIYGPDDDKNGSRLSGTVVKLTMAKETKTIFMSKSDLKNAFKILPILPQQHCFLVMKAQDPNSGEFRFFVEKNLPFGALISCTRFQLFSDSLHHIFEFIVGRSFCVTNYLDDYIFVTTNEAVCNHLVGSFLDLCEFIGCPVSLEKTEWASLIMVF